MKEKDHFSNLARFLCKLKKKQAKDTSSTKRKKEILKKKVVSDCAHETPNPYLIQIRFISLSRMSSRSSLITHLFINHKTKCICKDTVDRVFLSHYFFFVRTI